MSANYRNPNFLLPNEVNMATNPDLSVDRHSLYSTEFDGSSYIDLGDNDDLSFGNGSSDSPFTVSAWVYAEGSSTFPFFDKYPDAGTWSLREYRIEIFGTNKAVLIIYDGSATARHEIYSDSLITRDQWQHITITYDGSGGATAGNGVKMYINGSESTTTIVSYGNYVAMENTTTPVRIGRIVNTYADGKIDELALFNTALTQSQVQALADSKNSPVNIMALPTKPIAYYPLGEQARVGGNSNPNAGSSEWQFPNQSIQSTAVNFENSGPSSGSQTGGRIDLGSDINLGTQHTISLWIKLDPPSPASNNIFTILGSNYTPNKYTLWLFGLSIYYKPINAANNQFALWTIPNTSSVFDSSWHNIILNRDGSTLSLYLDNNQLTLSSNSITTGQGSIDTIGANHPGLPANYYLNGKLSNVVAWNSDQTSEKDNIYNNGTPASSYTNTPTAWYKLNAANSSYNTSNSTWTFTDSAGSNNGTSTTLPTSALVKSDLQFESPYSNFSLDFDGNSPYLDCGQASYLNATSTFSISTWFNTTTVQNADKFLIGIGSSASELWGVSLYQGDLIFYGGTSAIYKRYNGHVSINKWYHLTLVYNGNEAVGSRYKVYLNGALLADDFSPGTLPTVTPVFTTNLIIGKVPYLLSSYWRGKVDETALWNTALTAAQVNQIYNNGLASDLTSLSPVSWWRLGEDAYFVNNNITIPNQITGGPSGTGSGTQTSMLVADAPGSYGSGSGVNLDIVDRVGEAPGTSPVNVANSQSYNMIPDNRHSYVPGYVPAQVNNVASMSFDGVNDYFNLGNVFDNVFTSDNWSVSSWIYATANTSYDNFFNKGATVQFYLFSNKIQIYLAPSGIGVWPLESTATLSLNTWYNIIFTRSGNENKLYINGTLDNSKTSTGSISSSTGSLTIGAYSGGTNYFWEGNIDEVAIFNYALTPRQIKEDIYNASTTGKTADLNNNSNLTAPVAWYRMGD